MHRSFIRMEPLTFLAFNINPEAVAAAFPGARTKTP
jgi:hypothetical protein